MPNSIASVRPVGTDRAGFAFSVTRADNLAELIDLIPSVFRPRMRDLVNTVYRAAVKSNHARSYLSTLEKHHRDGTFPPEIGGRIQVPTVQISKEYKASAGWKTLEGELDTQTRAHQKAMLEKAISIKKAEVTYLQGLFSEPYYSADLEAIFKDVTTDLASDAGVELAADGSVPIEMLPPWIKNDLTTFAASKSLFPQRAVSLGFTAVQAESSKKLKTLSLKRSADQDIAMQDAPSQSETVSTLVDRKFEQLRKELKLSKPGNGKGPRTKKAKPKNPPSNSTKVEKKKKKEGGKGKGKGKKKSPDKSRS